MLGCGEYSLYSAEKGLKKTLNKRFYYRLKVLYRLFGLYHSLINH